MSYFGSTDYGLQVARGKVSGVTAVHKFGSAPASIQTTATDIWSYSITQQVWLAPTAARVHAIASTSDVDGKTGSPTSAGARTVRVYGLTTWGTAESSEVVTLDGTTPVNTGSSYVIIHRMKVLTYGASGPNVGTITATAASDATITATITIGDGQTEMAIYGVPSTQTFYMTHWRVAISKASGAAASVEYLLRVNEQADVLTTVFLRKDDLDLQEYGY